MKEYECQMCGMCCTGMSIEVKWNDDSAELAWARAHWRLDPDGSYGCDLLGTDGLCADYEHRPDMCREYRCVASEVAR
ncbi:MAG: YkgJ family cysteine cluster protein [Verrucomicrobiota bacterium]